MDADRQKIVEAMTKKKLNIQTNMGPPEPPKERSFLQILKEELTEPPRQTIHRVVRG